MANAERRGKGRGGRKRFIAGLQGKQAWPSTALHAAPEGRSGCGAGLERDDHRVQASLLPGRRTWLALSTQPAAPEGGRRMTDFSETGFVAVKSG
ncbi:hypothetical protein OCJ37_19545 [Xanthomonas sp. AM6]|uniref:hypothetical protein n=1 Tax=Xanthomonas sp. AM6 TaxID=2982531 RepID=UPI0021DB5051|nr:hypothetical protein [Xanthomonas sp. AM6]UYB54523.1 hypothetical protein OCJ37_19545 [Xanthomonas sp. AM6]